jgi:hypothetical protein
MPHLLFWIADKPAEEPNNLDGAKDPKKLDDPKGKGPAGMAERRVLGSRKDGREVVREHIFEVKL